MRVIAPGKLVLTGAYAVLDGAPAIVAAVDRYAISDQRSPANVDVSALHDDQGRKLGLGSSAASLVAALGSRALARGEDPRSARVRAEIYRAARAAHAREQGGGSGVDIAASVFGGVLRYAIGEGAPVMAPVALPSELVLAAYWSGKSARTSDLRARVDALKAIKPRSSVFDRLRELAENAAASVDAGDAKAFIEWAGAFGGALGVLGGAADAPIVLPAFAELASIAEGEAAAFLPSGAGGGDIAIWLGTGRPSAAFERRAEALGLRPLTISIDQGGVRPESLS
jgi:phosphomevalonate kinase